jgi:hypothetical protein
MRQDELRVCSELSRRRYILAAVAGAASLSGCGGDGDTETEPPETGTPSASARDPTDTPAEPTTTGEPGVGTQSQTPGTSEGSTATDRSESSLARSLSRSPSSHIGPADGFADISWVDERDLDIRRVQNLDSTGEGSLRWAVNQPGARLVVFEVGGVIDLNEQRLAIGDNNCWVAGHTAPSPGITLTRGEFRIDADECIVQHIRSRPGDAGNDGGWEPDAITTSDDTRDNVIDHCTATWSVDEALSVGYRTERTTVSNCMIAEPLNESTHSKGPHGYGSLTGNGASQVVYAGNIWAHALARNPRLKADTRSVVANNVMYNFDRGTNLDGSTIAAIHDNAYLRGGDDAHIEGPDADSSRASVEGNVTTDDVAMTANIDRMTLEPFWPEGLETVPGSDILDGVLGSAGARPAMRDSHERRVVEDIRDRTGSYLDSQTEVGGYPSMDPTTRSLDIPNGDEALVEWLYEHRTRVEDPGA